MPDTVVASARRAPLRLWPGVVLALLLVVVRFGLPLAGPDASLFGMPLMMIAIVGGPLFGVLILLWWLAFSRAPWTERVGMVLVIGVALAIARALVDPSISNGMMGAMPVFFGLPPVGLAVAGWAVATRRLQGASRWISMVAAVTVACVPLLLVRTGGLSGEGVSDLHWRWTPTPEEQLLAQAEPMPPPPAATQAPAAPAATPPVPPSAPAAPEPSPAPAPQAPEVPLAPSAPSAPSAQPPETPAAPAGTRPRPAWPSFRGPRRDGVAEAAHIATDWPASAPVEVWRRKVGPGWSSFAVAGDVFYTQEQRGEDEVVSSYRLATGEPVWQHRDRVRFWESNGGAGPRATPTLHDGRVYTMGATGIVNALDAATGARLWTRNVVADTGKTIPDWGIASSPLVVGDVVVVAADGQLAAYDTHTGATRWVGQPGGGGYSSPHLVTIDDVPQVVLLRGARTISVSPADGALLWEHVWDPAVSIVQPAMVDGDVLVNSSDGMNGGGVRRLAVTKDASGWRVEPRWTTRGLKPYFNDFVVHEGHAYGFDGSILASIDLADGARKWKGGRYGHGQMVLLPDQDLLLVLSEDGELALVKATPDRFTEIARMPAIEGKTWNHPVVVGEVILVRNGEEMAAFRIRAQEAEDRR